MPPSVDVSRFVVKEKRDPELWEMYQKSKASFWTPEEIDLATDIKDWNERLNDKERHFLKHVLAFFAASDNIVCENLATRFFREVEAPEAQAFYAFQIAMEVIHAETYQLLISTLVSSPEERAYLFSAVQTVPTVQRKAEWAIKWIENRDASFLERLVAFACVEGIFFSGSFASIFYMKSRGLLPGLSFSNQLISRDEGLHCDFACLMAKKTGSLKENPRFVQIVREAVEIEVEFVSTALPVRLLGMNADAMSDYIRFVADVLLLKLGLEKIYNVPNPFPFMEQISMQGKTNFFESRVAEYQRAGVMSCEGPLDRTFDTGVDF